MASPEIEEVKARLSIIDVVGQYIELRRAGRNWTARCPFHKERTPSFMVSPERGTYICFGCGEKGDIFSFIGKMEGIDFRATLEMLADRAGVVLPKFSAKSPEVKAQESQVRDRLMACCAEAALFFELELTKRADAREYIRKRTVSDATIQAWKIGYAPARWDALCKRLYERGFTREEIVGAGLAAVSSKTQPDRPEASIRSDDRLYDRFRGRIMFPLFDNAGRVIAFSGRFFVDMDESRKASNASSEPRAEPAKYVNSPETLLFKKSRVLYGLHAAKETMRKADCVLLVEGQFDLLLAHQSGLRFAVAVSGTALTPEHLSILARYSKRLVLGLDNDAAGLRSGIKSAAMALAAGFDVKIPRLPDDCKDPADAAAKDPELLRASVRESRTAIEFFLDALRASAKDERAYKKAVEASVLPLIAVLPSRIDQAHFTAIAADRLRVSETAVQAEVEKAGRRTATYHSDQSTSLTGSDMTKPEQSGSLTRLEQAAAMVIVHPNLPADIHSSLIDVLGTERVGEIESRAALQTEELRFRFDAMQGEKEEEQDERVQLQSLIKIMRQEKLDEDIVAVRTALREAQAAGDASKQAEYLRKMQLLAKQKHGL